MRQRGRSFFVFLSAVLLIMPLCALMVPKESLAADQPAITTSDELVKVLTGKTQGDKDVATIEYYRKAQGDGKLTEATAEMEKAAAKSPKDVSIQRGVAEGYVRQRDWDKVVKIYEQLAKENPNDYVVNGRLIDYYLLQKNFVPVIEKLEPIVKADPKDTYHADLLLTAYVGAKRVAEATNLFNQRLQQEPNSPGLLGRYARALMEFGKTDEAIKEWEKAYAADNTNIFFKQKIAECYEATGQAAKAKKIYEEIAKEASKNQSALKDVAEGKVNALKKK